jgi:peptidoglycan-N-acetylglucosamine deacetylase
VSTWNADADAADWRGVTVAGMLERAVAGLQRRNGGVLLLHDVQPVTAVALPALIAAVETAGFRFVRVVGSPGWTIERLRQVRIGTPR